MNVATNTLGSASSNFECLIAGLSGVVLGTVRLGIQEDRPRQAESRRG